MNMQKHTYPDMKTYDPQSHIEELRPANGACCSSRLLKPAYLVDDRNFYCQYDIKDSNPAFQPNALMPPNQRLIHHTPPLLQDGTALNTQLIFYSRPCTEIRLLIVFPQTPPFLFLSPPLSIPVIKLIQ